MLSTKARQDGFRLSLPNDFLLNNIKEKYSKILQNQRGFFTKPIDYLNESIQKVQLLGFSEATVVQQQHGIGSPLDPNNVNRIDANNFLHTASDFIYRSESNPLQLIDKTLNITFKHNLGFLNYFMLFENFWNQYARDTDQGIIPSTFCIDILNYDGSVYCRVLLHGIYMHGMDMLDLDYSQPVASSTTFNVVFKYSNIEFEFMNIDDKNTLTIS